MVICHSSVLLNKIKLIFYYFLQERWQWCHDILMFRPDKWHNLAFLESKFIFFWLFFVCLCGFVSLFVSASHEVLVVIHLDIREGKPQGNAWQGVLSMIPGSSLHSPAVNVGEYEGVIKDCCHVTVTNTVWNWDIWHKCRWWAAECGCVCVCRLAFVWFVFSDKGKGKVYFCVYLPV